LINWEQELTHKLLIGDEQKDFLIEFLVEGLLRGDSISRSQYYNQMFMMGSMSPNDIREKENRNPIDGGDAYYIPLNMMPVEQSEEENVIETKIRALARPKKGAALIRHKTANSYRRIFEDVGQKIVKRERDNVLKAAKKNLGERSIQLWNDWLTQFYREFMDYIKPSDCCLCLGLILVPIYMIVNTGRSIRLMKSLQYIRWRQLHNPPFC